MTKPALPGNIRRDVLETAGAVEGAAMTTGGAAAGVADRPNILWLASQDDGPITSAHGKACLLTQHRAEYLLGAARPLIARLDCGHRLDQNVGRGAVVRP